MGPTTPTPGTITAARVLLGLGAVGALFWALGAFATGAISLSAASALDQDASDATNAGLDASTGSSLAGLGFLSLLLGALLVALAVVDLRHSAGIGRAEARARKHLTWHIAADLVLALVLGGVVIGPSVVVLIVLALPVTALVLWLLWVPDSSRHWFGDVEPFSLPATRAALTSPATVTRPTPPRPAPPTVHRAPPWPSTELTVPQVVTSRPPGALAACGRCRHPRRGHDPFCGNCGARLAPHLPRRV